MDLALALRAIRKEYVQGHKSLEVLRGIDLDVRSGELVALVGASGSGKSTLLQIAGLLDRATSGTITIGGEDASTMRDDGRTRLRQQKLGFVYQFHHLLPDFTALENVQIALRIKGLSEKTAATEAKDILGYMGLADRLDHAPSQLSGGEQQRVAIARAVSGGPVLLLADEPTGNLDEDTAARVFELFVRLVRERGLAAVIATHDRSLAAQADRQLHLREGLLRDA
ncbi:MAG: ABC transporter ATP-binding protein [Alphaproteobacteria bacterium]|nr:MAG: ABC transporter ATP-binding protein [Alphaproteobacteria bacterium]